MTPNTATGQHARSEQDRKRNRQWTYCKYKEMVRLEGKVKASGAKNAMTKLLVASLLSKKKCVFYNVPAIGDVEITVTLCQELGSKVDWDKEKGILEIITKELKTSYISQVFQELTAFPFF